MQLESRDLRLVRAIVDAGGVTRAGKLLHLSQSAVSHQLAELERRLDLSLFARVGRRMVLTPRGERLATASRALLAELAELEAELRHGPAARRSLRLATECYTCYHWLPPLLARLPGTTVEIVLEATRQPLPALLEGRLDIALISEPARDKQITSEPLFSDEMVVIAAADHRLAARAVVAPDDLTRETLFTHELTAADTNRLRRALFGRARLPRPRRVVQVPLTEAIVELVRAGHGISLLSRWAVAPALRQGGLVARPLGRRGVYRHWSAAFRTADDSEPLRAFIQLLRQSRR